MESVMSEGSARNAVVMRVVKIWANRQSCDPSITLLFKLVLEVVSGCEKLVRRH